MRAVFSKQSLNKALEVLNKVVDKRSALPQLTWLKVASVNGYSQLQATDLEKYLTVRVEASTEEAGEVCVAMRDFAKLVKGRNKEILLCKEEDKLVVEVGSVKSRLSLGCVEKFPDFPVPTYEVVFPTKLLRDAIGKVGFAAATKDDYRDKLKCVYMDGEGSAVNFVASDGYRLAFLRVEFPFDMKLKFPQSGLKVLLELLKREKGDEVKLGKSEDFVFIAGTNWEMALRVLEWEYPDYKAVVPNEFRTRVLVDIKELDRALENFSNLETVVFHVGEGLKLRASWSEYGEENEVEAHVPAKVEGEALSVAFNPKFIKPFTEINEGTVEMLFVGDEEYPVMLKLSEEDFYLVMPKRLR
ncbi:MAG: DNA polymerase III subunit beta [Thermocrinis sp.]|jgi:DNA polymerase-3 subunit beta|uniref:DNA polymerase III subunit beta n=1 Tax=Thermocrinis sp. TaxID=2024383 RepID=UPI003C0DE034